MHTIKPIDSDTVINAARLTGNIITVEEHSIFGGLGGAVAEVVSQEAPVRMKILGIPDEDAINAKPLEIFEYYGLSAKGIASSAKKMLGKSRG
ncbi:MAG: hypothetical protein GXO81_11550 [Chlorobi bacterium]|nr:hypothetical protein [Chlorobiota bacterium]